MLMRRGITVLLIDLESTNGTLVNGVPMQPDVPLHLSDGDELQFGQVKARCVTPKMWMSGTTAPVPESSYEETITELYAAHLFTCRNDLDQYLHTESYSNAGPRVSDQGPAIV